MVYVEGSLREYLIQFREFQHHFDFAAANCRAYSLLSFFVTINRLFGVLLSK